MQNSVSGPWFNQFRESVDYNSIPAMLTSLLRNLCIFICFVSKILNNNRLNRKNVNSFNEDKTASLKNSSQT